MSADLNPELTSSEIQLAKTKEILQRNSWTKVIKTSGYSSMLSVERIGSRIGSSFQNLFHSLHGSSDLGYSKIDHVNMSPRTRSAYFEPASYESSMQNKVGCMQDDGLQGSVYLI